MTQWHGGKGSKNRISDYAAANKTLSRLYPEKNSSYRWCKSILGKEIEEIVMDPDGWRHNDNVDYSTRITKQDFANRLSESTVLHMHPSGYNLFLDDTRIPKFAYCSESGKCVTEAANLDSHDDWHIVRNFDSFVICISYLGLPKIISFDHDLCEVATQECIRGWDSSEPFNYDIEEMEPTGASCADYLVGFCEYTGQEIPKYLFHTANKKGEQNMRNILRGKTELHRLLND